MTLNQDPESTRGAETAHRESLVDSLLTIVAMVGAVGGAILGAALGAAVGTAFPLAWGTLGTMLGSGLAAGGWCLLAHFWARGSTQEWASDCDQEARTQPVSPSPSAR
jgi:hypothetical protein